MSHLYVPDDSGEYMDGIREATVPEVVAWLREQEVGREWNFRDKGVQPLPGRYYVVPLADESGGPS